MTLQAFDRIGKLRRWRLVFWAMLLLLTLAVAAHAEEAPYLELDTNGHMALIRSFCSRLTEAS